MPEILTSALAQVPIVAIFIWFVIYWTDRIEVKAKERDAAQREFWKEQREDDREAMKEISDAIKCLELRVRNHADSTDRNMAIMEERTKPLLELVNEKRKKE